MNTTDEDAKDARLRKARTDLRWMRINYEGRRPAAETLMNAFDSILDEADIEIGEIVVAKERDIESRYQGRLQQAEKREDDAREAAHNLRMQVGELRSAMEKKRVLREARKRDGSEVEVTIDREWSDDWDIADIEEIAYRLRAAGGTDHTGVSLSAREVKAHVPDPNVVTLGKSTRDVVTEHEAEVLEGRWRRIWSKTWPLLAVATGIPVLSQFAEWVF